MQTTKLIEKSRTSADGKFNDADLKDFISKNKLPLIVAFSQATGPAIFQSPVKKMVRNR